MPGEATVVEPLPVDVLERLARDFGERAAAMVALLLARRQCNSNDFIGDRLVRASFMLPSRTSAGFTSCSIWRARIIAMSSSLASTCLGLLSGTCVLRS